MDDIGPTWALLDESGVDGVIERAVVRVSRRTGVDPDDLRQEAYLLVATKADLLEAADMGLGLLRYRLECDLANVASSELTKANRSTSYEERYDDSTEYAPAPVALAVRNDGSAYTRELVEQLLPAVWDDEFVYGMRAENAPDADMPRGSINKATGGTLAAHIADIRWGWKRAPLTRDERCALLLRFGFDMTNVAAAKVLGVSGRTIGVRLYSGVGKVVARLNGDTNLADYLTVMDEELTRAGVSADA